MTALARFEAQRHSGIERLLDRGASSGETLCVASFAAESDFALGVTQSSVSIDDLLVAVRDDARFRLHYLRCRSRLSELLAVDLAETAAS